MKTNPWLVLGIVSSALFLIGIDMTVLNVALPRLTQELGASNADKLWMVNAYSLVMAGLLPGFGTLGDRIGHRQLLLGGLLVFGIASTLAAFSPTAWALIGSRVLLAVGAAMMMPATISLIRLSFIEDHERAIAIGIWGSVASGAAALGPIVGGLLLEHFWWGSVFLINVPVVLLTLVLTLAVIPKLPGNPARHWDLITSLLVMVALIGLVYAIKGLLKPQIHFEEVIPAGLVGLAFTWLFLRRQKSLPSPLLDFGLFRNPRFSAGVAAALIASLGLTGALFVLSQELQLVRGLSPLEAGFFLVAAAIASFVSGPLAGAVVMRVGVERMLALTLGVAAVGLALFALSGSGAPLAWQIATLAIVGAGMGAAMSVGSTAIMISAPEDRAGMAGSIESISYELGGTLGVAVMGSLVASVYAVGFVPPAGVELPAVAWDSIEQTIIAVEGSASAGPVLDAARSAYSQGVLVALGVATACVTALAAVVAVLARNKRPDATVYQH